MPMLIITDIDSCNIEDVESHLVTDFQMATDVLSEDLFRTASAEFTDFVMHYWAAKGDAVNGFEFTVSNTREPVGFASSGNRVRFAYQP